MSDHNQTDPPLPGTSTKYVNESGTEIPCILIWVSGNPYYLEPGHHKRWAVSVCAVKGNGDAPIYSDVEYRPETGKAYQSNGGPPY